MDFGLNINRNVWVHKDWLGDPMIQFGEKRTGRVYRVRPSVYGICARPDGALALARIGSRAPFDWDLPGGGIEQNEDVKDALVREFEEETGLKVAPVTMITQAAQYWSHDVRPKNSTASFWRVREVAQGGDPLERAHALVWTSPEDAMRLMRHDSHVWAIACWLRAGRP